MRNLAIINGPARPVKTEIRNVVLAAGIETSADLDTQVADALVEVEIVRRKPSAKLCRETARGRDAEFAGIRTRTSNGVDNRACPDVTQSDALQFAI
jgi:hypothetical protein